MAVVYQHRRNDTGEIFYIGIGKKESRSYNKSDRNNLWWKVVNKCGYTIEVIKKGLTWEEACKEEIRLIKLYGRKNLGLGPLVNMTDGGDGYLGYCPTKEWREEHSKKMSENNPFKGRKHSKYSKKLIGLNTIKIINEKGHPMNGKTHSKKSKKLMSKKAIGRVRTEDSKDKQSNTIKELFKTPEYKKILSISNRGENNASCKLTKEKVIWLRENQGNYSVKKIAEQYGMTRTSIYNILKGKTWKHI